MVNSNYQTVYYRPVGYNDYPRTVRNDIRIAPFRSQIPYKINEYFLRGLAYIQYILKLLLSSSPFLEQYGPVIKEIPKMYHIMKAIKEINTSELDEEDETYVENTFKQDEPLPKLFI